MAPAAMDVPLRCDGFAVPTLTVSEVKAQMTAQGGFICLRGGLQPGADLPNPSRQADGGPPGGGVRAEAAPPEEVPQANDGRLRPVSRPQPQPQL